MRVFRERKGQFIVIAALLISVMIISISTIIYGTVTYYRAERWEEYLTIIDSIKTGSTSLLEVSVANYSQTNNQNVLRDNLNQWIRDVRKAYPGFGVDLSYVLESGVRSAYGVSLNYSLGLARTWKQGSSGFSFSAANVTFTINIASVGLTGYSFSTHAFLMMNIRDAVWYSRSSKNYVSIYVIVEREALQPVISLSKSNFVDVKLSGLSQSFTFKKYYSTNYNSYVYELRVNSVTSMPSSVEVALVDARGIKTVSTSTTIRQDAS
jgi:hypothetical protein